MARAQRLVRDDKPVTVFLVTNVFLPDIGGISTYVSILERGLRTSYATRVFAYPSSLTVLEAKGAPKVLRALLHGLFILRVACALVAARIAKKTVIVHSHSAAFCLMTSYLGTLLGASAVHTFHSPLGRRSWVVANLAPHLDATIFVSPALRDQYQRVNGSRNALEVIMPGAVPELPRVDRPQGSESGRLRRQLELPPSSPIILFVGRVVPEKGLHVLLRAVSQLSTSDLRVVVAGPAGERREDREYAVELKNLAEGLGKGRVQWTGAVTDAKLRALYDTADVLVVPSLWPEPAPMVAIEAMAHGCPVIAARVGGIPYLVPDGEAGLLVPPNDPSSLASVIKRVIEDHELWTELSQGAARRAREKHSPERLIADHRHLYASLRRRRGESRRPRDEPPRPSDDVGSPVAFIQE